MDIGVAHGSRLWLRCRDLALYQSTVLSCAFIAVPFITVLANGVQSIVPNKKPSDNPPKEKQ